MDSGLARAFRAAVLVAGLALVAREALAQLTDQPAAGPPPAGPPPADGSPPQSAPGPEIPEGAAPPPAVADTTPSTNAVSNAPAAATPAPVAKPPPLPVGPAPPPRTPTAVMQVLDKVTAETLQFEAPIGRPIRYKTLVMTVRVCETRGAEDPQPRPSAYVVMETRAPGVPGHEPPPPKQVFDGWMFANAPSTHPLEHPIYDAWLVSCSAGTPVVRPPPPPVLVSNPVKKPPAAKVAAARPPTPPPPVSAPADNSPPPPE